MLWSRLHGLPPGLRYLPIEDWPPRPAPLLTQPWAAGVTGWVVVSGALIAELAGGIAVANQTSAVAVSVLIFPVMVAFGFAVVQWRQVRSWGAGPASWWHLGGIAAGVLTWLLWPVPGTLTGTWALPCTGSSQASCHVAPAIAEADYLRSVAQAFDYHWLAWWSAGALILVAALLARRSRIAAWAAIPAAFAGCELATYFVSLVG
jgi:hypothetical protein